MAKAVTTTKKKATGSAVAVYSPPTGMRENLKRRASESAVRAFPGKRLEFKKGRWFFIDGKNKKRVKEGHRFVMNLANAVEGYRTFVDDRPVYLHMQLFCSGKRLPSRDSLGQTDRTKWKRGDDGAPMDPFNRVLVVPIREEGEETMHHVQVQSISSIIALERLITGDFSEDARCETELPVVELGEAEERERNGTNQTYLVPTFSVVDWTEALACDNVEGGMFVGPKAEDEDADAEDEEEAEDAENAEEDEDADADADADDEDEDEDEEAPPPPPKKAKGKPTASSAPPAKTKAKSKADDDDDDDDDVYVSSRKKKTDDDDDDTPPPPKKMTIKTTGSRVALRN